MSTEAEIAAPGGTRRASVPTMPVAGGLWQELPGIASIAISSQYVHPSRHGVVMTMARLSEHNSGHNTKVRKELHKRKCRNYATNKVREKIVRPERFELPT